MTETLSTLSREQLQKLVQYAINEDPGGVLGKVFRRIGKQQIHLSWVRVLHSSQEYFSPLEILLLKRFDLKEC